MFVFGAEEGGVGMKEMLRCSGFSGGVSYTCIERV